MDNGQQPLIAGLTRDLSPLIAPLIPASELFLTRDLSPSSRA